MESIEKDNSVYAIRASKDMLEWMCDVTLGDPDDTPVTTQSNLRSNWRHWERFCAAAGVDDIGLGATNLGVGDVPSDAVPVEAGGGMTAEAAALAESGGTMGATHVWQ